MKGLRFLLIWGLFSILFCQALLAQDTIRMDRLTLGGRVFYWGAKRFTGQGWENYNRGVPKTRANFKDGWRHGRYQGWTAEGFVEVDLEFDMGEQVREGVIAIHRLRRQYTPERQDSYTLLDFQLQADTATYMFGGDYFTGEVFRYHPKVDKKSLTGGMIEGKKHGQWTSWYNYSTQKEEEESWRSGVYCRRSR